MSTVLEQLDYSQVAVPSATYRMRPVAPDAPVTGNRQSTFESSFSCPRQSVFNLARSELTFTLRVASSAADNKCVVVDSGMLPFDRVRVVTERGLVLADQSYSRTLSRLRPFFQNYKDLQAHSVVYPTVADGTIAIGNQGAQDSTTNFEPVGRLILSDTAVTATKVSGHGYKNHAGTMSDFEKAFGSYRQFIVSDTSNAAASTHMLVKYRIPLGEFFGTILALDKDLYFASESLLLQFTHSPIDRISFEGTDVGGSEVETLLPNDLAGGANFITDLSLQLAIQSNNVLANNIQSRVLTEGLTISYPMTWIQRRITDATTSYTDVMRLNLSKGKYLMKALFFLELPDAIATGWSNTVNNHTAAGVAAKWSKIRCAINSVWTSDYALSTQEAYRLNSESLNESMVQGFVGYNRVGAYFEDFTSSKTPDEFARRQQDACGLSLAQPIDLTVEFTKVAEALNIYTVCICQKEIRLTPAGVIEA